MQGDLNFSLSYGHAKNVYILTWYYAVSNEQQALKSHTIYGLPQQTLL